MPNLGRFVVGRLTRGVPSGTSRPHDCFLCGKPMKVEFASPRARCRSCDVSENILGWYERPPESKVFDGTEIRFVDHGGPVGYPTPDSHGYRQGL